VIVLTLRELELLLHRPKKGQMEILFDPLEFDFPRKMNLFESYLETTESFLKAEARQRGEKLKSEGQVFRQELERLKGGLRTLDDEYDYWEGMQDLRDEVKQVDEFASILRQSLFTSLYGYWESQLFVLCHSLESYDPFNMPSLCQKSSFTLKNARKFLGRIGFPLDGEVWQEIGNYRILRNCILHHEGKPEGARNEKELKDYICNAPLISVKEGPVVLNQGFCEEVHQTISKFFTELLSVLENWGAKCSSHSQTVR
jgi:hypothetical protein